MAPDGIVGQEEVGVLCGTVVDQDGLPLPGATIKISKGETPKVQITDAQGAFRFSSLEPDTYVLEVFLDGFNTVEFPQISVPLNFEGPFEIEMSEQTGPSICFAVPPLIDPRQTFLGRSIYWPDDTPGTRDPWSVIGRVAGILTDHVAVGGNEGGLRPRITGPGSMDRDLIRQLDGVVIPNVGSKSKAPYVSIDAFEFFDVKTGGSDVTLATPGVTLDLVTRRGVNIWRGSMRALRTDDRWQSSSNFDENELGPGQEQPPTRGRIISVGEWSANLSGPVVRDKLWIWTHYGRNDVDFLSFSEPPEAVEQEGYGTKLNAQLSGSDMFTFVYLAGEASQEDGLDLWKLEDTHVFSGNFFLFGMASSLTHREPSLDQAQARLGGSYFFKTHTSHDLKFGLGRRQVEVEWNTSCFGCQDGETVYEDLYLQDTIQNDALTVHVGLRYDGQQSRALLVGQRIAWQNVAPRLSAVYAFGQDRPVFVRASLARFSARMPNRKEGFSESWRPRVDPSLVDPDFIDRDIKTPVTDEIALTVEHEFSSTFLTGVTWIWRQTSDIVESERWVVDESGRGRPHLRSDYRVGRTFTSTLPDGREVRLPFYQLRAGLTDAGRFLTTGDRQRRYQGWTFFFQSWEALRWRLFGHVTFQQWAWRVPEGEREDPNIYLGGDHDDGGPVLQGPLRSSFSGNESYIHADWSYNITGRIPVGGYAKKWGFDVSATVRGRQGYPIPYFIDSGLQATAEADDFRYDDIHLVDLRLDKEFSFRQRAVALTVELDNATNESTVVRRQHQLDLPTTEHVLEVVNPRVWRFGIRFRFEKNP